MYECCVWGLFLCPCVIITSVNPRTQTIPVTWITEYICALSFLAGGKKEAHWKWHCHHSIPGRGWRIVILQTIDDPIALHPYPSHGQRLSEKWSGDHQRLLRGSSPNEQRARQPCYSDEMCDCCGVSYTINASFTSSSRYFCIS